VASTLKRMHGSAIEVLLQVDDLYLQKVMQAREDQFTSGSSDGLRLDIARRGPPSVSYRITLEYVVTAGE
jgi:hypothetical protein